MDTRRGSVHGHCVSDMEKLCYQVVSRLLGVPLGVYEADEVGDGMVSEDDRHVFKAVRAVECLGIGQISCIVPETLSERMREDPFVRRDPL